MEMQKALNYQGQSHSAERTLLISNLKPLNELETSRLEKVISPHKIVRNDFTTPAELLAQDLIAISEFLYFVDAEPYLTNEKDQNFKRVPFKKGKAA